MMGMAPTPSLPVTNIPDRDLLNTSNGRTRKTAARHRSRPPLDHLMNANSPFSPGMPMLYWRLMAFIHRRRDIRWSMGQIGLTLPTRHNPDSSSDLSALIGVQRGRPRWNGSDFVRIRQIEYSRFKSGAPLVRADHPGPSFEQQAGWEEASSCTALL